jgi:hypothetical protein
VGSGSKDVQLCRWRGGVKELTPFAPTVALFCHSRPGSLALPETTALRLYNCTRAAKLSLNLGGAEICRIQILAEYNQTIGARQTGATTLTSLISAPSVVSPTDERRAPSAERRTGTRRTERLQMDWQTLGQELPTGEVLVYSGSRIVVANVAEFSFDGRSVKSCMDSLANQILEWPTHWMPLPPHPRAGE